MKTLDAAFNVEPPSAAKKLRELMYEGYIIYDHTLHFYYLGGPDFIVGPDAPPEKRNILGVIEKAGLDIGKEVIKHRAYGQKITAILGGKVDQGVLNMVEMAFRAYDPCFACATHYAVGQMPLTVEIYNHKGQLVKAVKR